MNTGLFQQIIGLAFILLSGGCAVLGTTAGALIFVSSRRTIKGIDADEPNGVPT